MVAEVLPCTECSQLAEVRTSPLLSWITQTSLTLCLSHSGVSGCLWNCVCHSLKCYHAVSVQTLNTNFFLSHCGKRLKNLKAAVQRTEQKNRTLFCLPNSKILNKSVSHKNYGCSLWTFIQPVRTSLIIF